MKERLKLNPGDSLKETAHHTKGSLAETDIYEYSIINQAGEITGTVVHTDHTSIKGFNRTHTVVQKDSSGNVIVNESW